MTAPLAPIDRFRAESNARRATPAVTTDPAAPPAGAPPAPGKA